MTISQELKKLIKDKNLLCVDDFTLYMSSQQQSERTHIENIFIEESIKKLNMIDDEYKDFLNEEGIFYFHERTE